MRQHLRVFRVLLFGLCFLSLNSFAHGKAKVHESLEWLCFQSEIVFSGTIKRVDNRHGGGKSLSLVGLLIRGSTHKHPNVVSDFYVSLRTKNFKQLNRFRKRGTQMLFFTSKTSQSYYVSKRFRGDTWLLWKHESRTHWLVPSNTSFASAKTMQLVTGVPSVFRICRDVKKKFSSLSKEKKAIMYQWLTRTKTVILSPKHLFYRRFKCKGGCHLLVPTFLYVKQSRSNTASVKKKPSR